MPLIKSKSKGAFKKNVSEMIKAGHPKDQALAASYRIMRKAKASGGPISLDSISPGEKYDDGPTGWQQHRDTVQRLLAQDLADMPMYEPPETMDNNEMNPYPMQSVRFFGDYAPMNHAGGGAVESPEYLRALGELKIKQAARGWDGQMYAHKMLKQGDQARDISNAVPRRAAGGYAEGGTAPWFTRQAASKISKSGLLSGATPGRTDNLPIKVGSGSYVVPSDIVSGIGQGNTQAGAAVLSRMFKSDPLGLPPMKGRGGLGARSRMRAGKVPKGGKISPFADGGEVEMGAPQEPQEEVPIIAASGEFVLSPDEVAAFGGGDMKKGHDSLDAFVKYARQQIIKEMKNLKGPVKS